MNEKLMAGYTAYTDAAEYGVGAVGEAPATTPVCTFLMSAALSAQTVIGGC
ncbi:MULTISPECIES: LxmA leader domain family RiPP [unclassified Kitasatospora]|uniref:LxmA leader domain family RiPP n=1 Tax=unclassified Kitasatospora TaxID=2633591 RepID=UPI0033CE2E6B